MSKEDIINDNNSKTIISSSIVSSSLLQFILQNNQLLLYPTAGNWYHFPKEQMTCFDLVKMIQLYYPFQLEFFNSNEQSIQSLNENDIKMIDLSPFPIHKIFFNEIQLSENILVFLHPQTEYKLSPSSSLVILTN